MDEKQLIEKEKNRDKVGDEIANSIVRGALGAVPFVGTLLNEAMFDSRSRIEQRRINEFVGQLALEFKELDEVLIKKKYLESDEFIDLFQHITEKVKRSNLKEKMEIFSSFVVAASVEEHFSNDVFSHTYIDLIAEFNIYEIALLQKLYDYSKMVLRNREKKGHDADVDFRLDYSKETVLDIPKQFFKTTFDSLISKGLALDDGIGRFDYTPRQFIKPTDLCNSLMEYIESTAKISRK